MTITPPALTPLPHPRRYPFVGNLPQLLSGPTPLDVVLGMVGELGPIFELKVGGNRRIMLCDPEIVAEVCDDKRFQKAVPAVLEALRSIAGDGLFTVSSDAPVWGHAHRILVPAFKREAMQRYVPTMKSSTEELADCWARKGPDAVIEVMPQMTRLTLDIIGRTGFGYRFGALDAEDTHPFVEAMTEGLRQAMTLGLRPPFLNALMIGDARRFAAAVALVNGIMDEIIAERRANPALLQSEDDLLSLMLTARDPETGASLSDENARCQIITFLVAGHETTAGLMSFALMYLAQNPEVQTRAAIEAEQVLGSTDDLNFSHVLKLRYIQQIVHESLRLGPTVPAFVRTPLQDTVIGGRYAVHKGQMIILLLAALHRDRRVWGEDADRFDPDRFLPERVAARPKGAYLPFGTGPRACLGRQFAITEATLGLAMLLRRFEIREDRTSNPQVHYNLTTRLNGLRIRATPRAEDRAQQA